jgi:sigma-B regulation protein RsbU (phosphoserine phosphatase)
MTTAQLLKEEFMKHTRPFTGKVEFVFFENIVMEELKERLERLSSDSVVFYLSFFMDAAGHSFWPSEAIPQITQASPVPVYGAVDYLLGDEGYGIVGGRVKSSEYQGQIAARLAMEILDGKNVTEIPVVMESPNRYMFDYEQCLKFDIRIADLPTPRQMINEPESFYYKHKRKILTVIAIFGAMIIYIVILLFNIKKRIRAQRGLQTIIDSAASIVDYQSLEKFKEQLLEQLTKLLKIKKTVQFYKINTETEKDHSTFNFLPVDMPDEKNKRGTLSQQEKSLLLQSIKEGKCVISKNKGVAFLKSAYLPGNLVYFESSSRFDAIDRDLLEIFSNNISMSIENIEKFKIEESLKTARHIQMSMLPKAFSKFSGKYALDLHAYLCPAKEVGGDFYDFFSIDDDHVCFTLGDVSGKGVPAALFMAMTKSLIRVVAENNCDAGDIMSRSNNYLARDNEQAMFVTVFLAILNYKTGELTYANAGHNPPYMVSSNGNVKLLKTKHGIAMGVFENAGYIFETITLQPGDGLFVYSDGITEAKNPANEMFGNKRLEKTLKQYGPGPSQSMNTEITKSLQTFVNGAQQSDDITMLFVRMKKKEDSGG